MKLFSPLILCAAVCVGIQTAAQARGHSSDGSGEHYVSGHYSRSGRYVEGHYATNPDHNPYNNYSTQGNYNPHTGEWGTKRESSLVGGATMTVRTETFAATPAVASRTSSGSTYINAPAPAPVVEPKPIVAVATPVVASDSASSTSTPARALEATKLTAPHLLSSAVASRIRYSGKFQHDAYGTEYLASSAQRSAAPTSVQRDAHGRIQRSEAAKDQFMRMTGYPHGRLGYVVDHVVPLKRGGCDCPSNMQWQTVQEAKAKDRWE